MKRVKVQIKQWLLLLLRQTWGRDAGEKRNPSVEFKKQRRLNYLKRKLRNKSESNQEGISYESGFTLTLIYYMS